MINNPILVLALRLRPAPSAASPCDSAGSQQSRTSPTLHSLPTCDCRDSLHADEPLLIAQVINEGPYANTGGPRYENDGPAPSVAAVQCSARRQTMT